MDDLEESGDFGVFWSLFECRAAQTHQMISYGWRSSHHFQCRQFEVNQHPVAELMPVLLKSGQSASREEAVEEMKDCRPTVNP
ncbi:hypothetical protein F2Q70_00016959 [Brassica cretica]|uniref:Uncharacterized protein n=1 Tax=Brassica cretica TaxID=69181 RepID=A0A8S9HY72_BRACR|nr:hypothetical protein F2Q70_00016959 [Brassica cretica]